MSKASSVHSRPTIELSPGKRTGGVGGWGSLDVFSAHCGGVVCIWLSLEDGHESQGFAFE